MWAMGGVHLDADFIPCKDLDFMVDIPGVISFPVMPNFTHEVNGNAMSAPPHHRLFEHALETIIDIGPEITNLNNLQAAGPGIMARITDEYFEEIGVKLGPIHKGDSIMPFDADPVEGVIEINEDRQKDFWHAIVADIRFRGDTRNQYLYHLAARSWQGGNQMKSACFENPKLIGPFLEQFCSKDLTKEDDPHFERDCGHNDLENESSEIAVGN